MGPKKPRYHGLGGNAVPAKWRWFCERIALPIALALIAHWPKL